MQNKDLTPISLNEAARLLAVSPRTVRRLVDSGELTAVRIGSTLALSPDALPIPLRRACKADPQRQLLTLHDTAARLGCPPREVREYTKNGALPSIRIGGSVRWSSADIDAFLRQGRSS